MEQILHFMLSRDKRQEAIGDLSEDYKELSRELSRGWVNLWYCKEGLILLAGQILRIGRLIVYGIEEIIRRHFS